MSKTVRITLMASLAALAAGCTTTASNQSPGHKSSPSPPSGQAQAGQVGDKFTVTGSGGSKYDVTLLSVDQQAQPESEFLGAKAGHRLAAAQFRVGAITATDENSNLNATATGSNEQSYNSALIPVAAGTNFATGAIKLQPGASLVGWVSFELPDGVQVTKVQWTPSAGVSGHGAEWHVNSSAPPGGTATPTSTPTRGATQTPGSPPSTGNPGVTSPEATVLAYFDAINLGDYRKAWDLGGKNTTSSYSSFVSGFSNTKMVSAQVLDVSGVVVTASVTSLEKDGSTKSFRGEYTVQNGVITKFNVRQAS